MIDMIIVAVPKVSLESPLLAPSLLKTVLLQNNFTCKVKDWNYDLYKQIKDPKILDRQDLSFDDSIRFEVVWHDYLKEIALGWIKELEADEPKWFGISLLSSKNILISTEILKLVRKYLPDIKIVIGGGTVQIDSSMLPNGNSDLNIGEYFLKENLTDHYIIGDAENALPELLKGNLSYPGIDGNKSDIVNIEYLPVPDYEDLNMKNYSFYWLTGSRGCINNCTFCNVESNIFRSRKAESIAEETKAMNDKYRMRRVVFADNLINGNLKEFRRFKKFLPSCKYKNCIKWSGHMIVTSRMIEEDYKNAAECGMVGASIGVESGSERVRREMGKKFSNNTIYNTLKWYTKYGVKTQILLIIGWPSETEKDFQQTLDLITWSADNNIKLEFVNIGGTCQTSPNLQFFHDFKLKSDKDNMWYYKNNTKKLRVERWWKIRDHCLSLGYATQDSHIQRMKICHDRYCK